MKDVLITVAVVLVIMALLWLVIDLGGPRHCTQWANVKTPEKKLTITHFVEDPDGYMHKVDTEQVRPAHVDRVCVSR